MRQSERIMSEDEREELNKHAYNILCDCRKRVLQRHEFIGAIAMGLDLVPTYDINNPTAATDGTAIYFDIEYLSALKNEERDFTIAHEIWHNVMLHFMRLENRDRRLFNIATDLEVNQLLEKDGFVAPPDLCFPRSSKHPKGYDVPEGLSAEAYYDLLLDKQNSLQKVGCSMFGDNGEDGKNGNSKSLTGQFDNHIFEGDEFDKNDGKTQKGKYGMKGHDDNFRPLPTRDAVERVREAAVQAAQQIERSHGTLPDYIKKIVNELTEPEINWKEQLIAHVTSALGDKANWSMPNRRFVYSGVYLPSHMSEKLKIAIGIDTSGSTSNDLPKFLGEVNEIVKQFGNYELTVIQCDTEVKCVERYDEDHPLDLENTKFNFKGFGGTMLHPIFDYITDEKLDIDTAVIFTDGETEKFVEADAPQYPVMWMITKGGRKTNAGFGKVVEFKAK